ncbi:uncharacterized protein LOC116618165 [Nematostella vectensis]|uniref:uncharacterized protein LOC116618165 n=1 Tax=Nematostella vectensis TaxID=45351 RepID=UPI0013902DEC|nr:uncharacterized protein LOC116618165 [Nematostella vectensis]
MVRRAVILLLALFAALTTIYIHQTCNDGAVTKVSLIPQDAHSFSAPARTLRRDILKKGKDKRQNIETGSREILRRNPETNAAGMESVNLTSGRKRVLGGLRQEGMPAGKGEKQFLYVTQTEECLPGHFLRKDQLGPEGETYDLLVLSWKSQCTDLSKHYHNVRYLYPGINTTWSTGRNILFDQIMEEPKKYLYYIFMDDDIFLNFTDPSQVTFNRSSFLNEFLRKMVQKKCQVSNEISSGNSYRDFEKFLLEYLPAVGLLNFCFDGRKKCISTFYPDIWDSLCRYQGPVPFPYVSYSTFDAAINAFHRDAISHLLPYHVTYERVNWQESQKYLILEADIKFQGQVLYNMLITGYGTKHRPYPRHINWLQNWEKVLDDLRPQIEARYRNESEVVPFRLFKRRFDDFRNPLSPKQPVEPYRHYRLNCTRTCHHQPNMYRLYNG